MNKLHSILGLVFLIAGSASCKEKEGGACVDDSLCGQVTLLDAGDGYCEETSPPALVSVTSEGSAKCVIEALRDGAEGRVTIDRTPEANSGYCGQRRRIQILDGREAIVAEGTYADLGGSTEFRRAKLKPAEEYQKCLDDGPSAYAACLDDPLVFEAGEPACECDYCEPLFGNEQ